MDKQQRYDKLFKWLSAEKAKFLRNERLRKAATLCNAFTKASEEIRRDNDDILNTEFTRRMYRAIKEENYEEAAKLRDMAKELGIKIKM